MKNTTIFKRLLGYLKAYRLRLFFVLLSAVISTAFMVLAPFLVGKVTTTLFASIADKVFYWETIIWLLYHSCFPFCRDSVWQRSLQM
jgi:ABC-type multidrug transport system fused ATPase/permease subunit